MEKARKRTFEILQIGHRKDVASVAFDFFIVGVILVNLIVTFMDTFEEMNVYQKTIDTVELVTIIIFSVEYLLRIWTAKFLYKDKNNGQAIIAFIFSFYGIVDLLSFAPYYIPLFIPIGAVAFRMLRVFRILRLFRINTQYDAFNVIVDVLADKKGQLVSSVCIILVFMVAASMCMYSVEHDVQPEVFSNAFSGIWWASSALLTVGYGDMYPISTLGKLMGMIITFLGVGLVAIPTGIISAGFVEHYSRIKRQVSYDREQEIENINIEAGHDWVGKQIKDLDMFENDMIVMVGRKDRFFIPRAETRIKAKDVVYIKA